VETEEERAYGEKIVQLFGPSFDNVKPSEIIPHLKARYVLNKHDEEEIENTCIHRSQRDGMRLLLQRIQCYQRYVFRRVLPQTPQVGGLRCRTKWFSKRQGHVLG